MDHYCKNLLPDGTCMKNGEMCTEALTSNQVVPKIVDCLVMKLIPPACRFCSNHPINGGSGICSCTLGGMEFTSQTTTGEDVSYTTNINFNFNAEN